jgi:hypothetical protein
MGACRFYRSYLDAAHQVDAWIKEIWDFVQNDPQYKDKTALVLLLITVVVKAEWTSHGNKFEGSSGIYFAAMGPKLKVKEK